MSSAVYGRGMIARELFSFCIVVGGKSLHFSINQTPGRLWEQRIQGILHFSMAVPGLSCSMRDLVPRPGIEPGPPALGAWSLSPWTTREDSGCRFQDQAHIVSIPAL